MNKSKRLPAKERRAAILDAAVRLATQVGYTNIRRETVAQAAGVATGTVNLHYGTIIQLKRDVMRAAIAGQLLDIIAQGIVAKDPRALKVSQGLKRQALDSLLDGGAM